MEQRKPMNLWALVLAGGDGTRLQPLTQRISGSPIPKQYCRIFGNRSLLESTLTRIAPLAPRQRTMTIVNEDHLAIVGDQLRSLAPRNVLVQPLNRDTGPGLTFSLLSLARRCARARVAVFPSDHYVANARAFVAHVRRAARLVDAAPDKIALLGIEPERHDSELGYIEPAGTVAGHGGGAYHVAAFREKPAPEVVEELHRRGGLWNSFVMVFEVARVVDLLRRERPSDVRRMEGLIDGPPASRAAYDDLPRWNFSRDFLARIPRHLMVVRAGNTGWSDWGTPQAIARTFARYGKTAPWMEAPATAA
jgi:mannose-1-phosphate guanylyltransferase